MQDTKGAWQGSLGDMLIQCLSSVAFTVAFLWGPVVSAIFYPTCPPKESNRNTTLFLQKNPLWSTVGLHDVGMYSFHHPVQCHRNLALHLQEMDLQTERKF